MALVPAIVKGALIFQRKINGSHYLNHQRNIMKNTGSGINSPCKSCFYCICSLGYFSYNKKLKYLGGYIIL